MAAATVNPLDYIHINSPPQFVVIINLFEGKHISYSLFILDLSAPENVLGCPDMAASDKHQISADSVEKW